MLRESTTNLDINDLFLIATSLNNELNCVNDFSYKKSESILILKEFEQNVKIAIQKKIENMNEECFEQLIPMCFEAIYNKITFSIHGYKIFILMVLEVKPLLKIESIKNVMTFFILLQQSQYFGRTNLFIGIKIIQKLG